jgi:hypothetical protein
MNVTPDCTKSYSTQVVEWYVYNKKVPSRTGLKEKNDAYKRYYTKSSIVRRKKILRTVLDSKK